MDYCSIKNGINYIENIFEKLGIDLKGAEIDIENQTVTAKTDRAEYILKIAVELKEICSEDFWDGGLI